MGKKLGQKKKGRVHVFLVTPAYDGRVDTDYAISVTETAYAAPLFGVQLTGSIVANGAFIDLARNQFVERFLTRETESTHLFFVDSDLKFPARDFLWLASSEHPICAGVYCRRQEKEDYPVKLADHPEQGGLWVEDEWLMAERVPTGFLCIRRDVLEEMAAEAPRIKVQGADGYEEVPRLFYTDIGEDGRFIGEDFAFCDDYRKKYNKNIPVWSNIDFVHGGYKCNLHSYLEQKIEEEEERGTSAA